MESRSSTETDRRHLLSESVAPSTATSMIHHTDGEGDATPRARSPVRAASTVETLPKPYRGFPSEEAYIAALTEWCESRKYTEYPTGLIGFYGHKRAEEIAAQPKPDGLGLRKKWRARKERKAGDAQQAGEQRRNTVA